MWQQVSRRTLDVGAKAFELPTAKRHYAPDRQAEIDRVVIELWIDPPRIRGRVRIALSPLLDTDRLELDAAELSIRSVSDDRGRPLPFEIEDSRLAVLLDRRVHVGEPVSLSIEYEGAPRRGIYFIEPSRFDPDRPREVWTQGQDDDSRHWFPCFDAPNQKAKTELIAHVPRGQFALSNGDLIERRTGDEETVYHYRQETPHSTYLVSLVVGDYVALEARGGPVPVVSYVHPRDQKRGELTFARTHEMVRLFAERIGIPYPYPRYAQICVADFIFGGMENTTSTTLTELILFDKRSEPDFRTQAEALISHELAHQWWGDLVTCADWSHAWLNEGFATYFETIWREHADGKDDAAYQRFLDQEAYFGERYRRALVERMYEDPIDLFDRHQYEKGACVLHMIRKELGDGAFFRAIGLYGAKHRGRNVESNDLRRAVEESTGKNLEAFFDQWVFSPGHPSLAISGSWSPVEKSFDLDVEQKQPERSFTFGVDVEVVTDGGRRSHRVQVEDRKQTIHLPCEDRPKYVVFDRGGHLLAEIENRLPSDALRALVEGCDDPIAVIRAVRALAIRQEPASLEAVFGVLRDHPFYGVRLEAARTLERAPSDPSRDALVDAVIEDGDPRVRRAAIRALQAFKDEAEDIADILIRHVESETSDYAIADAVRTVAELRSSAAAEFVTSALSMTGHNHCVRAAAAESLARLRDLAGLETLRGLVGREHHPRVREAATTAIGKLGSLARDGSLARTEAKDRLLRLLGDPWLRVRINAAEALSTLGDRSAISALEEHAEKELDGRARRAMRLAARDLGRAGSALDEVDRVTAEVEKLRRDHRDLLDRIQKIEARANVDGENPKHGDEKKKKKKKKRK
jgi:aminopeptidase N